MKKEINEVQQYFKDQIIKGNYKLIKIDAWNAVILIDDIYTFTVWYASEHQGFKQSTPIQHNFILLPGFTFDEQKEAFSLLEPKIQAMKKATLLEEKLMQYKVLKVELELEGIIQKNKV